MKNKRMSDLLKKNLTAILSFLVSDLNKSLMVTHFWWATWAICSYHSLSLSKKEEMSKSLVFQKTYIKRNKKNILVKFCWAHRLFFVSKWAICSEKKSNLLIRSSIMSNLSKLLTVAHLSFATWGIHSRLLIWHERPERFAHSHSFVVIDLSKLLTVAHMIWAIWLWANE